MAVMEFVCTPNHNYSEHWTYVINCFSDKVSSRITCLTKPSLRRR